MSELYGNISVHVSFEATSTRSQWKYHWGLNDHIGILVSTT